jgi:hypothetical protein
MRFSPADAKARRPGWLDGDDAKVKTRVKAGGCAHSSPILGNEGASDRDRAIVLYEGMKAGQPSEDAEEMIGNRGTREIVDEPTVLVVRLHPS